MRYEVVIPGWAPTSLNVLTKGHWSKAHRAKVAYRDRVAQELDLARVPRVAMPRSVVRAIKATGIKNPVVLEGPIPRRRRLEVAIVLGTVREPDGRFRKGGQALDPDNVSKALRDALVEGGFLVDDSPQWLEGVEPSIVPDDGNGHRTRIILEDLEDR